MLHDEANKSIRQSDIDMPRPLANASSQFLRSVELISATIGRSDRHHTQTSLKLPLPVKLRWILPLDLNANDDNNREKW